MQVLYATRTERESGCGVRLIEVPGRCTFGMTYSPERTEYWFGRGAETNGAQRDVPDGVIHELESIGKLQGEGRINVHRYRVLLGRILTPES